MLGRKSFAAAALAVCCGSSLLGVPQAQARTAVSAAPAEAPAGREEGTLIARLSIPRIGLKAEVREGVGGSVLRRAVGHYPGTALPGQKGNTALFGHRTTWHRPFYKLDKMRRGDRIVLRAGRTSYVYKASSKRVIEPDDKRVLEPVPFKRNSAPDGRYVTLITCTPKGSDRYRLVVVGRLHHKKRIR
ncbi:class E sortase [Actinomadura sp. 7K507]|uniref:class E sortase n=1 Tax=Actinomadura sp. 7K507 TaxID=2530365 RepID=UPI0010462A16|nr:class E sortase [Actinomadura sp. 7K507]TDC78838.1 class E sortase [Actinomadura sp. 7K507]